MGDENYNSKSKRSSSSNNSQNSLEMKLARIQTDMDRLMIELYDLYEPVTVLNLRVNTEGVYRNTIDQQQRCHGFDGDKKTEANRCPFIADVLPYFCALHAPQRYKFLEVKPSTIPGAGYGLFVRETAPRAYEVGDLIVPYYGAVVNSSDRDWYDKSPSSYAFIMNTWTREELERASGGEFRDPHFNGVNTEYAIEANGTQTSLARWANHASEGRRRNVIFAPSKVATDQVNFLAQQRRDERTRSSAVDEQAILTPFVRVVGTHPWLMAVERIEPGEEILADYGRQFSFNNNNNRKN